MRLEHWFYTIPLRVRSLFRRYRVEDELDEELQFHLEQRIAQEMAGGRTAADARLVALQSMEGLEQRKEECRDMRGVNFLDDLQRNVGYAVRGLLRNPGFTGVTVITLALGIGCNSAIFSLVDTVMLRLLPVKAPEQLYFVGQSQPRMSVTWNYPAYTAMRDQSTAFTGLAGYSLFLAPVGVQSGNGTEIAAELAHGIFVSGNYFVVLGVSAALGRVFNTAEDRAPGASPYAVLSYAYWQSHFGRDTQVIGRNLRINGYPFTVIGVAPRGFTGTDVVLKPDLFFPIMMQSEVTHVSVDNWNDRHHQWMAVIGRLKPAASIKQAEGELFGICKEQESVERASLANPQLANKANQIVLSPAARGFSFYTEELKKPLLILFSIVALVLLIACANVANLMIARGAARQREIAVRLAIGASRWRLVSQLLTETMFIAVLGGVSGVFISLLGIRILLRFMPHPGHEITGLSATLDWRAIVFTATVSILTGLLFGIAPAWQSTRPDLVSSLKDDVPGSTGSGRFTLRKGLVILQVALSLPVLAGAGLFARTLGNLRARDTGFAHENVLLAHVNPTPFGYKGQRVRDFDDRLCARVAALPGVRSASLALITPLTGSGWDGGVTVEGYTRKAGERNNIRFNAVGARYFETLGTPILLGREFNEQDNPTVATELPEQPFAGMQIPDAPGRHVAIVNETFARHFSGDRIAIGMHVTMEGAYRSDTPYEIVGVVKDARYSSIRSAAEPMMFIPIWRRFAMERELVIRTASSMQQLQAMLRHEIRALDPMIPLLNIRTLEDDVDESILVERLVATLSGFFGILALVLSAVGLYGVIAYTVTRRTREIGIRLAIGAPRESVLWLVLRDVLSMVLIGGVIGSLAAFLATRAIASILYGVSAHDPMSLAVAGLSLAVAALVASFLPARRATKIDPTIALRYE